MPRIESFDSPNVGLRKLSDANLIQEPGNRLPNKSFIQSNRLHVRTVLLLVIPSLIILTNRSLLGTTTGLALYTAGSLLLLSAVVVRFWCYVYNSGTRTKTVITQGPYSLCRNPIYLCSIGVAASIGLLAESVVLAVVFAACAMLFYAHIIKGEEAKLSAIHGATYTDYLDSTSKYLPRFQRLSPGVIKEVPGKTLMRKIPKLIVLALVFPLMELCNTLQGMLGVSIWEVL